MIIHNKDSNETLKEKLFILIRISAYCNLTFNEVDEFPIF